MISFYTFQLSLTEIYFDVFINLSLNCVDFLNVTLWVRNEYFVTFRNNGYRPGLHDRKEKSAE
jgi:hypothetical protein